MILQLFVVLLTGSALADDSCSAYSWGDWSQCYGTIKCQNNMEIFSYPLQESSHMDSGRALMERMMETKQQQMVHRAHCKANDECPELMDRDSEGEAMCEDGFASSYPCFNIELLSFVNITDLGYKEPATGEIEPALNDLWGWTDPEDGEEYAIVGLTGGSSFVRVTDPRNPEVLGFLYTHTHAFTWRDMKVVNDHVYIVAESLDHGIQIFDLRRLRGRTADDFELFEVDAHYDMLGRAHNIAANPDTNTLYVIGCTDVGGRGNYTICEGGLHMVDVSDPQNPEFAGCYSEDGYTHDTHCVIYHGPDERYVGREICMAFNEDSLTVVDVTDKELPVMIAKSGYSTCRYAHQGWFTEDHRFVFGDDELDETLSMDRHTKTYFWDVQDLENITLKWMYQSTETSTDHNLYIIGPWVYQSNYEAGLRILYFDDEQEDVVETGYFDVLPDRTTVAFSGTWSNYPWYKNGMLAVTSIDFGLFLVQPDYEAMEEFAKNSSKSGHQSRMRKVPIDSSCTQMQVQTCQTQC